jgi:hypothetical protein
MREQGGMVSLLATLGEAPLWQIFSELAALEELQRSAVLRPHDEVSLDPKTDKYAMLMRTRLDYALGNLTLAEIAIELGLLTQEGFEAAGPGQGLADFHKLAASSEAFFRYASAYLYFGARLLSFRVFGPLWPDELPQTDPHAEQMNRRLFSIVTPPPLILATPGTGEIDPGMFEKFLSRQSETRWEVALGFLDGFHPGTSLASKVGVEETLARSSLQEPVQFELWLRGLLPEAGEAQQQRFERISDGIVAWVRSRTAFYLSLQKQHFLAAGETLIPPASRPAREAILTNPLTARFALADIYWIAGILRAEVSTNASVSDSRLSWLSLISFKAVLDRKSDVFVKHLHRSEMILRAVFGFVCDLVQNATALTVRREAEHFNPETLGQRSKRYQGAAKCTKEWRAVFDEELREIDRQRSRRTYTASNFPEDEAFPMNAMDADHYWSERLITGRQPHDRIGLAFSGGGIRSATFNLGILQGLKELDLLRHVDYLSTVSGGGFVGSWLVGNVYRTRQWLGRATRWDESISHLRSYSSYLAPLTGILSADTWTLAATWLRNTFLIQLSGITWILAVLLGVLGARRFFLDLAAPTFLVKIPILLPAGKQFAYASLGATLLGLAVTLVIILGFQGGVQTDKNKHMTTLRWWAVLASWIGSFVIASILWHSSGESFYQSDQSLHAFSSIFKRAWHQEKLLLTSDAIALLLIGWYALRPPPIASSPNSREPVTKLVWRSVWIGTLCVGVLYLALCAILFLDLWWRESDPVSFESYAFVFGPALVLSAFALSVVMFIGFSGRTTGEAEREWWTRFGAWLVIYATAGFALSAAAVFGPRAVEKLFSLSGKAGAIKWGAVVSWLGTVIAGLFAGNSSKTAGATAPGKKMGLELLAKAGGLVFVAGSIIATAYLLFAFLKNFTAASVPHSAYWATLDAISIKTILLVLLVIVPVGTLFSWFFEINIFGLSQFYRNRLVRCYLGATRWAPGIRKPHPFTGFDFKDDFAISELRRDFRGPFPIFNCTLNLGGSSDLTVHSRHSASFSLTPLRCGSDRPAVGYAPTFSVDPNGPSFAGGVKLGQAVAISGAAASPNMGYNTSPLVALLLTMFNVRLGWWFPNPGRSGWSSKGLRFSLYYLTRELLGLADEKRLFLNVSDGGHFENLGVYELVRRRCKVIIACDGECDEQLQFGGLGNLIRICATDFGAVIELDVRPIGQQRDDHSLSHCAVGRIRYSNGTVGFLIYLKASITGDEDIGVTQYRSAHPTFPHETTANQFFSEDQFESYRKLGHHIVRSSFRGIQPGEHPLSAANKLADVMVPPRVTGEAYLRHTRTLARLWQEFRRSPALHSFIDELLHITPPIAVIPPAPGDAHQASEELCMALQLIQLMEDVYMDLQLEDFWEHPDNRGWAILFMRWARSSRFRNCWNQTHRTYGIRFEYFCEARLGLVRDTPIVRM